MTRHVFPNGLTLLVQEDHSHPLAAFHATVRTGSATEGNLLGTGVSHVVEHMLFKGTPRRPVGAVEKEARSYGGTTQGFTTYDTTSYQVIVNKEFWSQAADLLVDALFSPNMDTEEFTKERQVVLRELKLGEDDPNHQAYELLFENAYRVHPYRIPIIGYEPLLLKLTRKDVLDYHHHWYLPNTLVIAVVGDVETQQAIHRFGELVSGIEQGLVPLPSLPQEPSHGAPREVTKEIKTALGVAAIGFPSVSVESQDLAPLDLLGWVLGGGRGSRLDRLLKETGIVYEVSSWNYTPKDRGLFVVNFRTDPEKMSKAIQLTMEECSRSGREPFSLEEVEEAKKAFLREYLAGRQTMGGQASDLAIYEVLVGDPNFSYRYMEAIQKVRPEDLQRVAHDYLDPHKVTVVRLLPVGQGTEPAEKVDRLSKIPGAVKETLKNGLRVIVREDHRIPLVTFQMSMRGGVRLETDQTNGISLLTARMLLRGTKQQTSQQIVDRLKQLGAELNPSSGRNSIGLTLEAVSSESLPAAELLAEIMQQPSFPTDELEKEKKLLLAELKEQEEEPFPWGMKRLSAALFTSHPYRLNPLGTPESVSHLTRNDLEKFYRRMLDPKQMVLSIVGDFKTSEILSLLEKTSGRMESIDAKTDSIPPETPLQGQKEHREVSPRQEGLLMIGFRGLAVTDPRLPYLDLIEEILSGGAGRLFSEIRERLGLAYTVGASAFPGIEPGGFILYAVTDPQQLPTVRQAVLEEVRRFCSTGISESELAQAKQGLLGSRRIARQSQAALATQMSLDELYGLGFNYPESYEARIQSATATDLLNTARDILDTERCVVIVGEPADKVDSSSKNHPSENSNVPLEDIRTLGH